MRVAHLNFINEAGVTRKLREEAESAREAGLAWDFFVISSDFEDHDEQNLRFRKRGPSPIGGPLRFIYSILFEKEDLVAPYINPADYDFIVLRFGKLFLGQLETFRLYGRKLLTEHHTDEIAELLLKRSLGRRLLAAISLHRSRRALRMVAGIVAVTEEILDLELAKAGPKPSFVFSNGIGRREQNLVPRSLGVGEALRLVFAAANFQKWQGLDRLLAGIPSYSGPRPIEVHLAGRIEDAQRKAIEDLVETSKISVVIHGLLSAEGLHQLYLEAHLGIAGLALWRNGLREACPLKVREYAALGLPFAYAYRDPDFTSDWAYALRLPDDDSPVDFARISAFAEELYARGDPSTAIRSFAREGLEWGAKLRALDGFLSDLKDKYTTQM